MEVLTFEDGSAYRGDDNCVQSVRDAETQTWTPAEPGRTYYDAYGRSWPGCATEIAQLPNTSIPAPHSGGVGEALGVILLIIAMLCAAKKGHSRG